METQASRRRISTIASHFVPTDEISSTHVLPLNCSSSLSSFIRRCDNRMYFARQGSSSLSSFMRPASIDEGNPAAQCGMRLKCSSSVSEASLNAPVYSRPAMVEPSAPNLGLVQAVQPLARGCSSASNEPPKFARATRRTSGRDHLFSKKQVFSSGSKGIEWSPRMDVLESGRGYVLTVEIPGVSISDIKVEVDDQKLTVSGKRSNKLAFFSNDVIPAYHRREILQGPYQVVWPLPANVNKDGVSAEFWDGFLQIKVPKL